LVTSAWNFGAVKVPERAPLSQAASSVAAASAHADYLYFSKSFYIWFYLSHNITNNEEPLNPPHCD